MPEHWSWDSPDTIISGLNTQTFSAKYDLNDSNYYPVNRVLSIEVSKKTIDLIVDDDLVIEKTYDGTKGITLTDEQRSKIHLSGSQIVNEGEVTLTFGSLEYASESAGTHDIRFKDFELSGEKSGNYELRLPTGVQGTILEGFTAIEGESFEIIGEKEGAWYVGEVFIKAKPGYKLSETNTDDGSWVDELKYSKTTDNREIEVYIRNVSGISKEISKPLNIKIKEQTSENKIETSDSDLSNDKFANGNEKSTNVNKNNESQFRDQTESNSKSERFSSSTTHESKEPQSKNQTDSNSKAEGVSNSATDENKESQSENESEFFEVNEKSTSKLSLFEATDTISAIHAQAPAGVIPSNALLKVEKIEVSSSNQRSNGVNLQNAIKIKFDNVLLYDISIVDENGNYLQPDTQYGLVTVHIPIDDNMNKNKLHLYRISEDGQSSTEIKFKIVEIQNRFYCEFKTDHFSLYALVESKDENNFNWFWLNLTVSSVVILLTLAFVYYRSRRKD